MSEMVLTGPLLDFGTSFWRSPLAMEEFPGLMAAGMDSIGRFGIGFFSVFMLGSSVKVFSRRCNQGAELGRLLEFRSGTSMRPILSQPDYRKLPLDGGTRVEVRLKIDPTQRGGLQYSLFYGAGPLPLPALVGLLAPNLNVALFVRSDGVETQITRPGDWLDIADEQFAFRLSPWKSKGPPDHKLMRIVLNEDGQTVGRAAIHPEAEYSYYPTGGWVSVAGLRATRMRNVSGVFLGEAMTAARDTAVPMVDDAGLAKWASEQAELICQHVHDEEKQAEAAEVILGCGGTLGNLKIVCFGGEWLDQHQLTALVKDRVKLSIQLEGEFSYDEDHDDVFPRAFRDSFQMAGDVAMVPSHEGSILKNSFARWPNIDPPPGDLKTRLAAFVIEVITRAWGGRIESTPETRVVGDVDGTLIERDVDRLSIPSPLPWDDEVET